MRFHRIVAAVVLTATALPHPSRAFDKPTGAPLFMSEIETEQPIPLAYLSPDGKSAGCSLIRLHWSPSATVTSADDTASFALDIAPESAGAATFTAQLWSASLAGSLAWQKPWQGAHWKIFETPATDGTGIDAGLAVGMIATSARRPYPKDTLVIGNLHPDSSLGVVFRLADRLDAAAKAGITRVIIPKTELFETSASGAPVDIMRHASDLKLTCIPVDNIVQATEVVMNDPLPDPPTGSGPPKYSADVAAYMDDFAKREQAEAESGLQFAPREDLLSQYPPRQAAVWKLVFAETKEGNEAYKSGEVYVAWRLLARANSRMRGMNALTGQELASFDVKSALSDSDQLQQQVHELLQQPAIDRAELQSGLLVAEMADWAYDISAILEGSELVTKQTFSQRSDATTAERDRAREAILSANEEAKYLLEGASFYTGLLSYLGEPNPLPANTNAANLLPQLIPAQLATAQIFTDGIRPQANELRVGLLFDPRLVAYVNVLREEQSAWSAGLRRKLGETPPPAAAGSGTSTAAAGSGDTTNSAPANPAAGTNGAPIAATPANATNSAPVGFDPGNAYAPPHTVVEANDDGQKKMSDVGQCLIWVNTDCEIASLDQKYLRLAGTVDPATREWHAKDRSQLDALLQLADSGAQQGAAFAQEAQVGPDIFAMILERASYLRLHGDDANALAAVREYWRGALLGNMCWQLAHTQKAAAVDLSAETSSGKKSSREKDKDKKSADKVAEKDKADKAKASEEKTAATPPPATNAAPVNPPPEVPPSAVANDVNASTNADQAPAPSTNSVAVVPPTAPSPAPAMEAPPAVLDPDTVPIAPVAHVVPGETNQPPPPDVEAPHDPSDTSTETNVAPVPPGDHAFPRALPVDLSTNASTGDVPAASADGEYTGGDSGAPPTAPVAAPAAASTNGAPATP